MCHFDRHSLQTNVICRVCPGNNSANCFCKPSTFSDMPQILSGTESLVLTWEVCFHKRSGKSRKSKCCTVVPFGFYLFWRRNWEKVKDGGESKGRKEGRKEGGRKGGGPLKKCSLCRHGNQENNTWLVSPAFIQQTAAAAAAVLHSFYNMVSFSAH